MQNVNVFRVPMAHPADVTGLSALLSEGVVEAGDIVAVLGKTEGNGCVNDFTRGYATMAWATALATSLGVRVDEVERRVAFVMSGGTEGVMSPHATIFARREVPDEPSSGDKRLAIGIAFTRDFLPEEIGRRVMVTETAAAVRQSMSDAGIDDPAHVHFVQIKAPLLTADRIDEARQRGETVVTEDTYKSMDYARGGSYARHEHGLRAPKEGLGCGHSK